MYHHGTDLSIVLEARGSLRELGKSSLPDLLDSSPIDRNVLRNIVAFLDADSQAANPPPPPPSMPYPRRGGWSEVATHAHCL